MGDSRPILLSHRRRSVADLCQGSRTRDSNLSFFLGGCSCLLGMPAENHQQKPGPGSTNEHHPKGHFRRTARQAVLEITSCDYNHMSGRLLTVLVVRTELVTLPEPNFLLPENCLRQAAGMSGRTEHLD